MAARLGLANPPTPRECKPRTVPDGPDTQQLMETKKLCRDPGSNRGPSDLQSDTLAAELSRLMIHLFLGGSYLIERQQPFCPHTPPRNSSPPAAAPPATPPRTPQPMSACDCRSDSGAAVNDEPVLASPLRRTCNHHLRLRATGARTSRAVATPATGHTFAN